MKKILIYTFSLLLAAATASCIDDKLNYNGLDNDSTGELTLDFNLEIPTPQSIKTRGELLDMAAHENDVDYGSKLRPYIFIFEDTGSPESNYLRTIIHGNRITLEPNQEHEKCTKMSAVVSGTAENALLHIVLIQEGDKDEFEQQLAEISDRSEIGMFSGATGLYSCGATYWKRIQLNMPLNKESLQRIKDEGLLQHLQMVRNFVQIKVKTSAEVNNFELTGFVVLNGMDRAYVAPYNESTGEGYDNFVDFEQISKDLQSENLPSDDNSGMAFYNYLTRTVKYIPARHPLASREYKDNDLTDWLPDVVWNKADKYTFERPLEDTRMTCVLIKGTYNGQTECYYKLDIGDYDRTEYVEGSDYNGHGVFQLYNLIRNVIYDITITDVGAAGHESVESAIVSPPANNISASVKTRNVLTITDFVDTFEVKMFTYNRDGQTLSDKYVDGTTLVIIDDEENPGNPYPQKVRLQWRYEDGEEDKFLTELSHMHTGFELTVGDIIKSINGKEDDSWSWESYGDNYKDGPNWYYCDIEFNAPTDIPQQKTIKLYKPFGLSRDITFILRKRWEFINDNAADANRNIEVYPGEYGFIPENTMPAETLGDVKKLIPGPDDVGSMRNAQLTVMFELPADIPQSLFPLEFKLGFDRQNTDNAYVGNAVVVYGDSMFEDQTDRDDPNRLVPRMQFVKTIDWDYYNGTGDRGDHGHKIVCVRFVTTTDVIADLTDLWATGNTDQKSKTRVRVYNQYFTLGEGYFTRDASSPDPDPNQTEWFWFFGDYGWQNDSENYTSTGQGNYTGLYFNTHDWGTQWGRYMGFAHNLHNINTSADINDSNYSFYFEPGATAPADGNGYTATLTITGASLYYSRSNTWYRRRAIVRINVKQTDGTTRQILLNRDGANNNNNANELVPFFFQSQDGNGKGMPRACEETFEIEPGETIEKVTIWSARYNTDNTNANYAKTLYYSIRLSLAAK